MKWWKTSASGCDAPEARCRRWRPCWLKVANAATSSLSSSAATKALEQVGFRLIASGLTYCLEHPDEAAESGYPLDEVQRLFTKLA